MQSDGGLAPVDSFSGHKAVLSGPAGGYVGYALTTRWEGAAAAIAADTGADVRKLQVGLVCWRRRQRLWVLWVLGFRTGDWHDCDAGVLSGSTGSWYLPGVLQRQPCVCISIHFFICLPLQIVAAFPDSARLSPASASLATKQHSLSRSSSRLLPSPNPHVAPVR